jgi:hypothetical protein
MGEREVLKPGGFWICPTCGRRNKVWAPCSQCGTALAGMPETPGPPEVTATAASRFRPRRTWPVYVMVALGVAAAVGVGVLLARMLGGAALVSDEPSPGPSPRAAASAAPSPEPIPTSVARPPRAAEVPPPTPPAAVYTPSLPAPRPGYSIPAPAAPGRARPVPEARAGADLRARQQAVRAAQARFDRAEAALGGLTADDAATETQAMRELEDAARALREAEAALDRARRRRR